MMGMQSGVEIANSVIIQSIRVAPGKTIDICAHSRHNGMTCLLTVCLHFIRQAIEILDDIHSGKTTGCDGFVWQCENHWQIENFYQMADEELKKKFEAYVRSGEIGLSGNYLNITELVSAPVLNDSLYKNTIEIGAFAIGVKICTSTCQFVAPSIFADSQISEEIPIRKFLSTNMAKGILMAQ